MIYKVDRKIICISLFLLFLVFWFLFWFGAKGDLGKEWFTPSGYYKITWSPPTELGGWQASQLSYKVYISSTNNCSVAPIKKDLKYNMAPNETLEYDWRDGDFGKDYYISVVAVAPDETVGIPACIPFTPQSPQEITFTGITKLDKSPILPGYNLMDGFAFQLTSNMTMSQIKKLLGININTGNVGLSVRQIGLEPSGVSIKGGSNAICQYEGLKTNLTLLNPDDTGNVAYLSLKDFSKYCTIPKNIEGLIVSGEGYSMGSIFEYNSLDGSIEGKQIPFTYKFTGTLPSIGAVQNLQISGFIQSA